MQRLPHQLLAAVIRSLVVAASIAVAVFALPTPAVASGQHVVHGTLLDAAGPALPPANDACLTTEQLLTGTAAGETVADGTACASDPAAVGAPGAHCVGTHAKSGDAVTVVDVHGRIVARAAIDAGTVQDAVAMTCRFDFALRVPADSARYTFTYTLASGSRSVTYTARQIRLGHWSVGLAI
jgi:hypothetical protein